jgi:hypothetical protein
MFQLASKSLDEFFQLPDDFRHRRDDSQRPENPTIDVFALGENERGIGHERRESSRLHEQRNSSQSISLELELLGIAEKDEFLLYTLQRSLYRYQVQDSLWYYTACPCSIR